ncbi:MAG: LamG-like jellyroll fold domain-containing protein [Ilumatobacteraceae bacterium]
MDVGTLIRILIRRWWVVLPLLGLTFGGAFWFSSSVEPAYQTKAAVLLIGPSIQGGQEINPLAEVPRTLNTTAVAIALIVSDTEVRDELSSLGFVPTYTITVTPDTPIINVTVRSDSPEGALATLDSVVDFIRVKLDNEQSEFGSPEEQYIRTALLQRSSRAQALYGARDRVVLIVLGLGAALTAVVAVAINSLLAERERDDQRILAEHMTTLLPLDDNDALSPLNAARDSGPPRGLVALYEFGQGSGDVIEDVSGVGEPMDLHVVPPESVVWHDDGLELAPGARVSTAGPATKLIDAVGGPDGSGEYSIEAWILPRTTPDDRGGPLVVLGTKSGGTAIHLAESTNGISSASGARAYFSKTPHESNGRNGDRTDSLPTHVVLTRRDGMSLLYVDGVMVRRASSDQLDPWDGDSVLSIGGGLTDDDDVWSGRIISIALYARALESSEILDRVAVGH